uniref:Ig-like domain-containing protein n=1 Tax=Astyanax mexicanus TaxID=7994 RepID=W5L7Y7_ASTMX
KMLNFYLLFIVLHVSEGESETLITAYTGKSVLLPCSCTDLQTTPDTFSWKKHNTISNTWDNISSESDQYRNRVQLFNNLSPANLSLLISHLTEEDAGEYRCDVKYAEITDIRLTVKDCILVNRGETLSITAHTGESVLLPCSCTDLNSTPDTFSWRKHNTTSDRLEEISSESDQYRNRVQLFNNLSPANLSLLISHLTEEDDGVYRCNIEHGKFRDIGLTVKGKILLLGLLSILFWLLGTLTITVFNELHLVSVLFFYSIYSKDHKTNLFNYSNHSIISQTKCYTQHTASS